MSYRVRVTIDVINEDEEPVDFKGYSSNSRRMSVPMVSLIIAHQTDDVDAARERLNTIHRIITAVKEIQ